MPSPLTVSLAALALCQGIWYQKLTELTATSSWKKVAKEGMNSVFVPKEQGIGG